jgi:hypothetical protein
MAQLIDPGLACEVRAGTSPTTQAPRHLVGAITIRWKPQRRTMPARIATNKLTRLSRPAMPEHGRRHLRIAS